MSSTASRCQIGVCADVLCKASCHLQESLGSLSAPELAAASFSEKLLDTSARLDQTRSPERKKESLERE